MNLIKYRNLFFGLSLAIIIPSVIALFIWGLRLGIDFSGGTLWEMQFTEPKGEIKAADLSSFLSKEGADVSSVASTSANSFMVRMKIADEGKINDLRSKVSETYGKNQDLRLNTVGPVISKELTQKALAAVGISIIAIVAYVTWAFRKIPKPASSIAFGICTIV